MRAHLRRHHGSGYLGGLPGQPAGPVVTGLVWVLIVIMIGTPAIVFTADFMQQHWLSSRARVGRWMKRRNLNRR